MYQLKINFKNAWEKYIGELIEFREYLGHLSKKHRYVKDIIRITSSNVVFQDSFIYIMTYVLHTHLISIAKWCWQLEL
jgi:hypothetical protein